MRRCHDANVVAGLHKLMMDQEYAIRPDDGWLVEHRVAIKIVDLFNILPTDELAAVLAILNDAKVNRNVAHNGMQVFDNEYAFRFVRDILAEFIMLSRLWLINREMRGVKTNLDDALIVPGRYAAVRMSIQACTEKKWQQPQGRFDTSIHYCFAEYLTDNFSGKLQQYFSDDLACDDVLAIIHDGRRQVNPAAGKQQQANLDGRCLSA